MKIILLFFSLLFAVNVCVGQESKTNTQINQKQKMRIATIGINGMACQAGCADKIAINLKKTKGVVSATVSYDEKEAVVEFDTTLISPLVLKSIITNTKVKEYIYTINTITINE